MSKKPGAVSRRKTFWLAAVLVGLMLVPPTAGHAALRGAFYYPWYPATWTVNGAHVSYHPLLGYYSSSDPAVIDRHIAALNYANVDVAIASWFGPGSQSESTRIPMLLNRTVPPLKWALYYECEGNSPSGPSCKSGGPNPSVSAIQSDLAYAASYAASPAYLHLKGKPVIFVWSVGDNACEVASRWKQAAPGWYVDLKLSSGFQSCPDQPDAWHQYAPSSATQHHAGYYYSISPGFKRADGGGNTLQRDPNRWYQQVRDLVSSGEPWQLITTFNEWGEGTAVEGAQEWNSPSGYGTYLDALHSQGSGSPSTTPGPPRANTVRPPSIHDLSVSPRRFRPGVRAKVRYRLSAAATVRFKFERLHRRKALGGSLRLHGRAGRNSFRFRGRLRGHALPAGRYRIVATPIGSSGKVGKSKRARFRILEPRR